MKKSFIWIVTVLLVLSWGCSSALAQDEVEHKNVKIQLNGEKIILLDEKEEQQKSIVYNERIYIPIDCFINAIGGNVTYNADENQLTISLTDLQTPLADATPTPAPTASKSAIEALSGTGRQIFDALLIMLDDFYSPASVRVMEVTRYDEREDERKENSIYAGPDTVVVRLSGLNGFGGVANNYYQLCLTDWTASTDYAIKSVQSSKFFGRSYLRYEGAVGEYFEISPEDLEKMSGYGFTESMVTSLNAALEEYWSAKHIY